MTKRILISGSTGFIGRHLIKYLFEKDFEIFQLVRKKGGERSIFWDPKKKLIDQEKIKDFDVIVHLAGESVTGLWTKAKRQKIYESRIESTRFLIEALQRLDAMPKIFIAASAVGYYNYKNGHTHTEESEAGGGFLSKICKAWEDQTLNIKSSRVVNLRFGNVLGKDGGLLPKIKLMHNLWLGGKLGDGKQSISWVAIDDVVRIIDFVIQNQNINGPLNVTSPCFITQEEFGKEVSKILNKPFFFHIPKFFLRLALGAQANEILLASIKAFPKKLKEFNFQFKFENLTDALKHYI